MSTLVTNTITGLSTAANITIGSTPVVSASATSLTIRGEGAVQTSIQQGIAKSWIDVDQTSGSQVINDSFNVTSVTDTAVGQTTVTIANDMASANYCATAGTNQVTIAYSNNVFAAGAYKMDALNGSNADTDSEYVGTTIHGDLA